MILENLNRVVFAGDSITDMQRAYPIGEGLNDRAGFGYVRMIDNLLAAWYPEICVRVTNAGISGNTSRDLRARYERFGTLAGLCFHMYRHQRRLAAV